MVIASALGAQGGSPFLGDQTFDHETRRIMGVAFELAHAALVKDWGSYADAILAKRIIELAKGGELNPDLI